jgi:hypothetical protein
MNIVQFFPRHPSSSAQGSAGWSADDTTSRSNDGLRAWKRACQIVENVPRAGINSSPLIGSISLEEMPSSGHGEANNETWKLDFRWTPVSR